MSNLPDQRRFSLASRVAAAASILFLCALSGGCGSTEMVQSWRSAEFTGPACQKVLVVGMAARPEVRREYEDAFVRQLQGMGLQGVASHTLLPDVPKADRAAIAQAAGQCGADGVLVTHLVKREKEVVTQPPPVDLQEYIDTAWPGTYTPVAAREVDIVTLETRLFDVPKGQLIWWGTTETFDASNLETAIDDVCRTVAKEMVKQKVL